LAGMIRVNPDLFFKVYYEPICERLQPKDIMLNREKTGRKQKTLAKATRKLSDYVTIKESLSPTQTQPPRTMFRSVTILILAIVMSAGYLFLSGQDQAFAQPQGAQGAGDPEIKKLGEAITQLHEERQKLLGAWPGTAPNPKRREELRAKLNENGAALKAKLDTLLTMLYEKKQACEKAVQESANQREELTKQYQQQLVDLKTRAATLNVQLRDPKLTLKEKQKILDEIKNMPAKWDQLTKEKQKKEQEIKVQLEKDQEALKKDLSCQKLLTQYTKYLVYYKSVFITVWTPKPPEKMTKKEEEPLYFTSYTPSPESDGGCSTKNPCPTGQCCVFKGGKYECIALECTASISGTGDIKLKVDDKTLRPFLAEKGGSSQSVEIPPELLTAACKYGNSQASSASSTSASPDEPPSSLTSSMNISQIDPTELTYSIPGESSYASQCKDAYVQINCNCPPSDPIPASSGTTMPPKDCPLKTQVEIKCPCCEELGYVDPTDPDVERKLNEKCRLDSSSSESDPIPGGCYRKVTINLKDTPLNGEGQLECLECAKREYECCDYKTGPITAAKSTDEIEYKIETMANAVRAQGSSGLRGQACLGGCYEKKDDKCGWYCPKGTTTVGPALYQRDLDTRYCCACLGLNTKCQSDKGLKECSTAQQSNDLQDMGCECVDKNLYCTDRPLNSIAGYEQHVPVVSGNMVVRKGFEPGKGICACGLCDTTVCGTRLLSSTFNKQQCHPIIRAEARE